jgi:hypothetical protein
VPYDLEALLIESLMDFGEMVSGFLSGDMAALNAIWLVLLPFALLGAAIKALADKARRR